MKRVGPLAYVLRAITKLTCGILIAFAIGHKRKNPPRQLCAFITNIWEAASRLSHWVTVGSPPAFGAS
jgi:hypothetical protein